MRRRVLRNVDEQRNLSQQIVITGGAVTAAAQEIRGAAATLASIATAFGGLMLGAAFISQILIWVNSRLCLIPCVPTFLPAFWLPWLFAGGLILLVVAMFAKFSAGRFMLLVILGGGYLALAMGVI